MRKILLLLAIVGISVLLTGCAGEAKKEAQTTEITSTPMTATAPSFNPELEKAKEERVKLILELVKLRAEQKGVVLDKDNPEDPFKTE